MRRLPPVINWPWYLRLLTLPILLVAIIALMIEGAATYAAKGVVFGIAILVGDPDA